MSTIFTKIIEGEIPGYKIAEDENYFAFLDINPSVEGHTLVIPKKEIDYIFDLNDQELSGLMVFAKKVAQGIDKALEPIRTGIIVEGLAVPHAHVHLIPIYAENQRFSLGKKVDVSENRMKELANQISNSVEL
ncbi:MAG: HIT family protein [Balneolaceae bacterium]